MIDRFAARKVRDAMSDTPVVVIQGPRQCGKTTLAREVMPDLPYVTLDDSIALDAAQRNPKSFLSAYKDGVILDEVQRAPDLFRSLKAEVDKDRRPGRFLVTGSSNILLLPKLSESLAGRMEVVPLWPLSQAEIGGSSTSFIQNLIDGNKPVGSEPFDRSVLAIGGFPEPVHRATDARRRAWFDAYLKALIERDVRDIADIEGLTSLPRLLRMLARQTSDQLNIAGLSRESGIPHTTLTRYVSLLEAVFLVWNIPAWQSGLSHRAIKGSRICFADTGILCTLLGVSPQKLSNDDPLFKQLVVNFIAMEIRKQAANLEESVEVCHFRSIRQYEVPVVLLFPDGKIIGIDVCEEDHITPAHLRPLEFLAQVAEDRFAGGCLLHCGTETQAIGENLWSAPITSLWS